MTTPTSYARSIFQPLIDEGTQLKSTLLATANLLNSALLNARTARQKARDAQEALTEAEQELLFDEMMKGADGVFGKVSKTGKDFQIVYDGFLAKARKEKLSYLVQRMQAARSEQERTDLILEQTQAQFKAQCYSANLHTAMLEAVKV